MTAFGLSSAAGTNPDVLGNVTGILRSIGHESKFDMVGHPEGNGFVTWSVPLNKQHFYTNRNGGGATFTIVVSPKLTGNRVPKFKPNKKDRGEGVQAEFNGQYPRTMLSTIISWKWTWDLYYLNFPVVDELFTLRIDHLHRLMISALLGYQEKKEAKENGDDSSRIFVHIEKCKEKMFAIMEELTTMFEDRRLCEGAVYIKNVQGYKLSRDRTGQLKTKGLQTVNVTLTCNVQPHEEVVGLPCMTIACQLFERSGVLNRHLNGNFNFEYGNIVGGNGDLYNLVQKFHPQLKDTSDSRRRAVPSRRSVAWKAEVENSTEWKFVKMNEAQILEELLEDYKEEIAREAVRIKVGRAKKRGDQLGEFNRAKQRNQQLGELDDVLAQLNPDSAPPAAVRPARQRPTAEYLRRMRDAGSPGESHAELTPDQAASVEDILAQLEQDGRSTAADEQAGSDDDSRPKGPFEETTPSGVHRGTTPGGQEKRDSDTDGGFLEQVVREANAKKAKSKLKSSQSNLEPVQPSDPKLKRAKLRRKKNVIETDQRANDSGSSQRPADIERELKPKRGTPQDRYQRTESFKSRTPTRPVPGRVGETIRATGGRIDRESAGAGQKLTNQSTPPRNPPPDKAKDKRTPDRAAEAHAGRRGTSSPSKLQGSNARTKKDSAEAASRNPRDKPASRVPETAPRQPRVTQTNPDQASQPQTAPRQPRVTQTNPDQTGKPKIRVVGQPRVTVGSPTSSPGATVRVAASPSAGQQTTSGSPKVRIDPQGGRRPDGENPESGPVVQPTPPVAGGEASKRPGGTGDKSGGRGHRSDASGRKKKTGTAKRPESASTK